MGFNVLNVAISGKPIDEIHSILKLRPIDQCDSEPDAPVVAAALPSGWYLLYFNDRLPPTESQFAQLSAGANVLYLDVGESATASFASGWRDGRQIWSISHNMKPGDRDLECSGELPDCFHSIAESQRQQQVGAKGIDCLFDVPVEVVNHQIGFRYDGNPDGYPVDEFQILERLAPRRPWWQFW